MQRKNDTLYLFIFLFIGIIIFVSYFEFHKNRIRIIGDQQLRKGIFNLSDIESYDNKAFIIEGEAEFYWNKLLFPNDFYSLTPPLPDGYIKIPGVWNDFEFKGEKIKGNGYATYRFLIKVNEDGWYGLRFKEFDSAYKVWANTKHVSGSGLVNKSKESYKPSWKRNVLIVESVNGEIEIVLQIANFDHRKGGAEDQIYFGKADEIVNLKNRQTIVSSFLIGILLMLSIYHFMLYFFRQKDISMLVFSSLSFFMTLRLMSTGEKLLLDLFPNISWLSAIRIEYLSYQIALPLMYGFFYSFYQRILSKTILHATNIIAAVFCAIVLFSPASYFSFTPLVYQFFAFVVAIYMMVKLLYASIHKFDYALIFLSGFFVFFITLINDILYYNKWIESTFLMHWGLFVMAISQSVVLSKRFASALNSVESLSDKLEKHNLELEKTIELRTKQILNQKEEIELQAIELKRVNDNLLELTTFKESLTQMIIHDLKNPLNIVLNFSNDERVVFAGTQMLNLVQNLLDVQRYEKNKMDLHIETTSVNQLINSAITQLNYLIQEKNITIRTKISTDYLIKADVEIMLRVFVNLLSNALKFTPNNGNISVATLIKNNQVNICITDSGPGIPEDQKELVFQKFGQYLIRRMGKTGSTGIGLTFCKMAIEAHKGSIDFTSKLGKGTTFCCFLPMATPMQNTKTDNGVNTNIHTDFTFTPQEKDFLSEVIVVLKNVKIYEISKIKQLIAKLEPNENINISMWISSIRKAILTGNQEFFNQLIEKAE